MALLGPIPTVTPEEPAAGLDLGIAYYVNRLRMEFGIETCQACEGGPGHSYPVPIIDIHGNAASEGWRALAACLTLGFPVTEISRHWRVEHGAPVEAIWRLEFARKNTPEELAQMHESIAKDQLMQHLANGGLAGLDPAQLGRDMRAMGYARYENPYSRGDAGCEVWDEGYMQGPREAYKESGISYAPVGAAASNGVAL